MDYSGELEGMYPLLILDRGNTTIKIVLIGEEGVLKRWKLGSQDEFNKVRTILGETSFTGVAFSSVVPEWSEWFVAELSRIGRKSSFQVKSTVKLPFKIAVNQPEQVGADRLSAASGAYWLGYREVVVVDIGTAITVDIMQGGEFQGGVIFPGPVLIYSSLFDGTSALPNMREIVADVEPPGKTTEEAMECGVVWGISGAIEKVVERMWKNFNRHFPVIVTGGGWNIVNNRIGIDCHYYPDLTIKGIEYLYRLKNMD